MYSNDFFVGDTAIRRWAVFEFHFHYLGKNRFTSFSLILYWSNRTMSLTPSHEKVRKPLRGSSITTPETNKDSFAPERSFSVPNLQIHANPSSMPTRSDSLNAVNFLREDSKQSIWQTHPWMNSLDSKDVSVLPIWSGSWELCLKRLMRNQICLLL